MQNRSEPEIQINTWGKVLSCTSRSVHWGKVGTFEAVGKDRKEERGLVFLAPGFLETKVAGKEVQGFRVEKKGVHLKQSLLLSLPLCLCFNCGRFCFVLPWLSCAVLSILPNSIRPRPGRGSRTAPTGWSRPRRCRSWSGARGCCKEKEGRKVW